MTLLPAEQQSNRGSIVASVEDLLYSAPTDTGAHHRYIQRPDPHWGPPSLHTMLCKWGLLLWGQSGRGVTLATQIDLPQIFITRV
jgi:hypothetical protein